MIYHITATWTENGTVNSCVSHQTHHDVPLYDTLDAVRDRLAEGAVVIEIKRVNQRRQAEKGSV